MVDLLFYLFPASLIALATMLHLRSHRKSSEHHAAVLQETIESGLTEPPSLHPVIDTSVCMGSGACASACPESALGVISGKGLLVSPTHCIGHGACAPACPVGAIKLVFGTAKRGVEIPQVNPDFETNVPGLFIAGELGGMGLIRNAVKQGTQAVRTIASRPRGNADFDLIIIGAGPAGIAASLAAKESHLKFITLEQEDSFGGTTYHYPRNKLVMTAPMILPIIGEIKVKEISKENLMEIWNSVVERTKLPIHFSEKMEAIEKDGDGFIVRSTQQQYRTSHVLLALGRRGTPRKLGVPGENQAKVVYRLLEAEQYRNQHVLVVGGGDSALEAALDIAEVPGTTVSLSYRGDAFGRVKPKNRKRLEEAQSKNVIRVILNSSPISIEELTVSLKIENETESIQNDAVIVCAGGELPTPILKKIGIHVEAHYGE